MILLACLTGTDLLTGLIVLPLAFSLDLKRLLGVGPFCSPEKALNVIIVMSVFASFGHLVVISIDRFIAIKYPLALIMTTSELVLALIDSKSICLIYSLVKSVTQSVTGILFIITISLSYRYIYSETRRQVKRLKAEQLAALRGRPKNQERQKGSYHSGHHSHYFSNHLFTTNNNGVTDCFFW